MTHKTKRALQAWSALFLWVMSFAWIAPHWITPASAQASVVDLADGVPGQKNLTYFDLLRLVVPDLSRSGKDGASGHKTVAFTHIEGKDARVEPPETMTLASVVMLPIPGETDRILLLADLGQPEDAAASASLLMLFALTPQPRLLDVTEVGTDRFTGLRDGALQMLAPGTPLLLIDSSHFNSNQNYNSTEMIFIRQDHFALIESVFTFHDSSCSYDRTQVPEFTLLPSRGPFQAVQVRVRETVELTEQDCGDEKPPLAKVTRYEAIYRWDAARQRFVTSSDALQRLLDADKKRF